MSQGKALIFSAPSGSGKTTIVRHLLKIRSDLEFSISATTRPSRSGEIDGKDYYFLSLHEFQDKIEANHFLEYEQVYDGIFYGSLRSEVQRLWDNGKHVVFDVDVIGGLRLKNSLGKDALSVFVKVPEIDSIEKRLRSRGTESEDMLNTRLKKVRQEMQYENQFDIVLINNILEDTLQKAEVIAHQFLDNTI